ncbi:uncharacterized protein LOC109854179 [Pseudomyrmex gracilis]|uniref:uncharacterized protein LOC109854179 n=1 Tax=Pseudomyrmex gracilis TaxID=219809 RepID=UPI0009958348|nr:uncharacterized protein LOC109854179 [Pseudomyrmex gracilis]
MCKTHDLIKQYTEKVRENDNLKADLELAKKETKNIISNYKSAKDKTKELELEIAENKQKTEELTKNINEYKVDVAASKQTIRQLHCKIKSMEEEHSIKIMEYNLQNSSLKEKIRSLEHELKKLKMKSMRREKEIICTDTAELNIKTKSTSDVGINVTPIQMRESAIDVKPELQNKSIMTDEFYSMKDDPYPLFCSKCEARLSPTLLPEKICKTMSTHPQLIENNFLFSPIKAYRPSYLLNSNSTNKIENTRFKISMPCLNSFDSENVKTFQSGYPSTAMSTSENVKLNNTCGTVRLPATNLSDKYNSNPAILAASEYINFTKKDFPDDLVTEDSLAFKNVKNRIETLEEEVKKLRKTKKRLNTSLCSHRHVMNCNNDSMLNSHLVTAICKGIAEYYNEKSGAIVSAMENLKNVHNVDTKERSNIKRKKMKEKIKKLFKMDTCNEDNSENVCYQVENINEEDIVDSLYDKTNNATEGKNIAQSEFPLHVNTNNSIPDKNISSRATDTYKTEEKAINNELLPKGISFHSAEAGEAFVEDILITSHLDHKLSHLRNDELHTSDNLFNDNNVQSIDTRENNLTTTEVLSLEEENFDRDIVDTAEATKRRKKSGEVQNKSNRLFKKIRNLKKKTRENTCVRTQKNVEMCSDYNSVQSELRIEDEDKNEEGLSANNITGLKRKLIVTEHCISTKKPKIEKEREDVIDNALVKNITSLKSKLSQADSSINEDIEIETDLNQQNKESTFMQFFRNDVEESHTPMSQLIRYIDQKSTKREMRNTRGSLKKITHIHTIADKFVQKQLQRLINSDWDDSVHFEVTDKLNTTCGPRIIAKGVVTFVSKYTEFHNEVPDKSFTPPAPLMMPFEQKIITLLNDLKVLKPTVIYFVQMAIEYALFKHNSDEKMPAIESLTRIYVVLALIQKDREKVRMMCCDSLYCILSIKSMTILYTILTCWSEVLPKAETNKEILPKCIAFLINASNITSNTDPRTTTVKKLKALISKYYEYNHLEVNNFVKELITILQNKRTEDLDTAIILVAKRQGSFWAYKNIIQCDLLPMIIGSRHPCIYSAFSLLGRLLHAFPLKDDKKLVHEISEQLRDIIESGSDDQQEGVVSALLSLSRHRFDLVASSVIKWTPNRSLRPTTIRQLQAFLSQYEPRFWKLYLQKMHIKSIQTTT